MTDPILNALEDEAKNWHFEEEVDALERQLALEKVKARIGVTTTKVIEALSARPSDKGKSKASSPRIYHGQPRERGDDRSGEGSR